MALLNSIIKAERPKKEGNSFGIVMVHYSRLIPSESNNYSVDNIRELANMIKLSGGVKQNLLARKKTPEEYELIAGHRRRLAVKYLVEEEGLEEFAMLPVHVEKSGDILSEIDLILTNCGARERSDWEKMMEVTRLAELMKAMQTGTEEEQERFRQLFGRDPGMTGGRELRKLIADTLGLSETKVANLNHINSSLAPELKERFEGGEIGVSVANEAAGLPAEKQQELAKKPEIRLADVKAEKKKTVSESDTEEQIPGQTELLDIPEANLENTDGYCENGSEPEESTEEIAAEPLSAYGTPKRVYPPDSLISEAGCEGGPYHCFSCAMDCQIRQKDRYCREAPLGNPFPCEIVKGGFTELPEGCQFLNHDLAYHCAGSGEPDPCCKDCQDPCEYICGRAMKALDQKTKEASQTEEWAEPEEIIDSEFSEASERLEPIEYDRNTLLKMISETKEQLELMKDYWIRNQSLTYAKYAMKLKAYENLLLLHDQEPEAVDAAMKERDEKFGQVEVELYFTAFGLALEELHGFNQEQITMVWKKADQYIKSIIDGDETKETLQQKLLDRANVMCSFR